MRKVLASFVAVLVLVGGLQAVSLSNTATPAFADACSDGVACIGVSVDLGTDGGGGTGIGGGGDGDSTGGTVESPRVSYDSRSCGASYIPNRACSGSYRGETEGITSYNCPPLADGRSAISVTFRILSVTKRGKFVTAYTCNYPAAPPNPNTVLRTVRCYTDYDASLFQSQTKPGIAPGNGSRPGGRSAPNPQLNLDAPGPNPSAGNNPSLNLNACGSFTGGAQFNLNAPQDGGYGYYRIDLNPRYRNCSLIGYPLWANNTSRDRINCSGIISAGTFSSYAISACNYNYTKYSSYASMPANVNFAISACENFRCVVDGSTTILGHTDPISVMRNGENLPVRYATIHIEHGPNARPISPATTFDISATTNVVNGSSPYNKSTTVNGAKQYFQLKDTAGKRQNFGAWEAQTQVDDLLAFNWASDQNTSWRLERTWRVNNAEFFVPVPSNTGGGYTMQWQNEVIYCGSSLSNPVTVVRSVNETTDDNNN